MDRRKLDNMVNRRHSSLCSV